MIEASTSRLFPSEDIERSKSKKAGVYIYKNTFFDQIVKWVASLFGRTLSVTVALPGASREIHISKVSLQKFLQRAQVDNPYALSNDKLRDIVRHISQRLPAFDSFTQQLTQLQTQADALSQKCQRVHDQQYGNTSYQELTDFAKQTSEGIKQWCASRIVARSRQRTKVLVEETLADPLHKSQEQQDRDECAIRTQMLERANQAQDSLASLCRYAHDKYRGDRTRFPDFRVRREVLDLFRGGAMPDRRAVPFVHHMYALVHDCESAYAAEKAQVEHYCRIQNRPDLIQPLLQEIERLAHPLLNTDLWPPVSPPGSEKDLMVLMQNLSAVDSDATREYVRQKKQELHDRVQQLLSTIQPPKPFESLLRTAQRYGLRTGGTVETYILKTEEDVYWQLARENDYMMLPPGDGSDTFVRRYNEWRSRALTQDLQGLGLNLNKPTRNVGTFDEYLGEVARVNSFATCDKPCRPELESLRARYNQRALTQRAAWLSQPHFAGLPTIVKITKRNLTKILPFQAGAQLGKGSSKVVHHITVFRPHERPQKIKVLGWANVEGMTVPVQMDQRRKVNEELVQEHQLSEEFRQRGVPNLAFVRRVTSVDGQISYAYMDHCDGGQLDEFFGRYGATVSHQDRLAMAQELAQALSGMHASGYCHGDLKTLNVLVQTQRAPDGTVHPHAKLSDFGRTVRVGTTGEKGLQGTFAPP